MLFRRFVRQPCGQDLIEYLLLGAFIALVALSASGSLGVSLNGWSIAVATFVGPGDGASGGGTGGSSGKSNCSATGALKSGGKCQQ
jgi:Flp pilus assembly pilin Flp